MKRDDPFIKSIIENLFDDFLRFMFPDAEEMFDFSKGFEFLEQELRKLFPEDKKQADLRIVDKLIKVYTLRGTIEYILLHLEAQGQKDNAFPWRMYKYYIRIWDKFNVPVTALALFTDNHPTYEPNTFTQTCAGTTVTYTYNTYKVFNQSDEALFASHNPFAIVVLIIKTALNGRIQSNEDLYKHKWAIAKELFSRDIPKEKIRHLREFLHYFLCFDDTEMNRKFEEEVAILANNDQNTMGTTEYLRDKFIKEGIEKGEKRGEKRGVKIGEERGVKIGEERGVKIGEERGVEKSVSSMLLKGNFSDAEIADLLSVTVSFVETVRAKLHTK